MRWVLIFRRSFPAPQTSNEAQIQAWSSYWTSPATNLVLATLPLIGPRQPLAWVCRLTGYAGCAWRRADNRCVGRPASCMVKGLIRALRPPPVSKNVLVFVGPAAAGACTPPPHLGKPWGPGIFCAAASATYLLNDSVDGRIGPGPSGQAQSPDASGEVPIPLAMAPGWCWDWILGGGLCVGLVEAGAGGWASMWSSPRPISLYFKRVPLSLSWPLWPRARLAGHCRAWPPMCPSPPGSWP